MPSKNRINWLYWLLHFCIKLYMRTLCRLRLVGIENIPRQGGLIIASNHIAGADPFLLGSAVPRELWYMAKKELFKPFILGWFISRVNAFPVDRFGFDLEVIRKSLYVLEEGKALIMFPEGTRSRDGDVGEGKIGVGMLARKARVPIVPTFLENSRKAWWNFLTGKRLKVIFGPIMTLEWINSKENSKAGYKEITDELTRRIRAIKTGSPDE
jgi:1-acyl-sn-glycerol-3-phosphate acyltransferase